MTWIHAEAAEPTGRGGRGKGSGAFQALLHSSALGGVALADCGWGSLPGGASGQQLLGCGASGLCLLLSRSTAFAGVRLTSAGWHSWVPAGLVCVWEPSGGLPGLGTGCCMRRDLYRLRCHL